MVEKVRSTIAKYSMLNAGDSVVAGVSGGADSVCLLHVLLALRGEFDLKLSAAHLNHKLRGDESDRDESFVKDLCKRLNVDLTVESEDVAALAKKGGLSIEEAGRNARYAFFGRCGCKRVAVAHSLGDSIETMLLNLARGTALRGLAGIPPKRGGIIRPLIECGRVEIEAYCKENGLDFITDSTNLSDDYARNRIRRQVIPALLSVNGGLWGHAANTLEALRLDADFLDRLAGDRDTSLRSEYLLLQRPVRYRVLLRLLSRYGIPADNARLARMDAIVESGTGAEQLDGVYYFKSDKRGFRIEGARKAEGYFCIPVDIPNKGISAEINVFPDKKLRLMNIDYRHYEENIKNAEKGLKNVLDCDKIIGRLVLRQKLPADKIRLCGRNCTKTLRKLFQEEKLTPAIRERLLVLADNEGPVWVEGFGTAERAGVSDSSGRILVLGAVENAQA